MSNQWYVLGAGAMGCLWATNLMQNHTPCTLIAKNHLLEKFKATNDSTNISRSHITLEYIGTSKNANTFVSSHLINIIGKNSTLDTPIKNLLVATKAQNSLEAIKGIEHLLDDNPVIVLLQNGLGSQEKICEAYPKTTIIAVVTTNGAWVEPYNLNKPNTISLHHAGYGKTWMGLLQGNRDKPFEWPILCKDLLKIKHMDVIPCYDINFRLWMKLAINSAINGLTAKYQCQNGMLLYNSDYWNEVCQLINETTSLIQKLNSVTMFNLKEKVTEVVKTTRNNYSSTYQDAANNKPTELKYINGYLLKQAETVAIKLKNHESLLQHLKKMGVSY